MKNTYKWGAIGFGISLVSTLVYGQARAPSARVDGKAIAPSSVASTGAVSGSTFNSTTASGNQAYTCTNTGCRLSLGNTGRYLLDDGTNLEFVAPVQGTSFEALATSGSSFIGGNSSAVMTVTSNTTDAITSTTVPAIRLQSSVNIDNNDLLLSVEDSAGNRRLTLTEVGTAVFAGASTFNGSVVAQAGLVAALYIERTPTSISIPDDGAGTAAAYTWQPAAGRATTHFTCLDSNGCDITMSETGAGNGFQNRAINIGTNTINFADTAGVTELNGAFAMGSYDVLELGYVVDRFVEIARSNN